MIETTTVSEEGYACTSQVGDFDMTIDATGEEGPTANQSLVATYASCFLPAFRVAAQQRGYDDIGRVQIDAEGDLDDDDDVSAIRFTIQVEAELDDQDHDDLIDRAEDICHVHSAVRDELHAEIELESGV